MLHPQFGNPGLATQALIRVAKPSYTTGTLSDIKNGKIYNYSAPPSMAVQEEYFINNEK
jgi:hypothetical protein